MHRKVLVVLGLCAAAVAGCTAEESSDGPVNVVDRSDTGTVEDGGADTEQSEEDTAGGGETGDTATERVDTSDTSDTSTEPSGIPVLGDGADSPDSVQIDKIADDLQGLTGPRDVEFNPEASRELWIVNRNDHSVVVLQNAGTDSQEAQKFSGSNSRHFLAKPAALAFGQPGRMATAQQENKKTQPQTPPDFMGVTLWTTDLSEFDAGHASHYDMMHNSPLASGITWEEKNAYWVFDGSHGSITMYDFKDDHGAGGKDHSDGVVRRYLDGELKVVEGVVGHVDLDRDSGLLYFADTGHGRVGVLDTSTGEVGGPITPNYDGSDQKYVRNAESRTLIDGSQTGLSKPSGLELHEDRLFVADNETSTIHAFTLEGEPVDSLDLSNRISEGGLEGMAFDEEGDLYVVNSEKSTILRISPKSE